MKLLKQIITAVLAVSLTASSLIAQKNEALIDCNTKLAAITQSLRERNAFTEKTIKQQSLVSFNNNIRELLVLDDDLAKDPEMLEAFVDCLDFMIEDYPIKPGESKLIPLHKDKPFTISIVIKRGKMKALTELLKKRQDQKSLQLTTQEKEKSATDYLESLKINGANLLSAGVIWECTLPEQNHHSNNVQYIDEKIIEQPVMIKALSNVKNFAKIIWEHTVKWSANPWKLHINFHLPKIEQSNA